MLPAPTISSTDSSTTDPRIDETFLDEIVHWNTGLDVPAPLEVTAAEQELVASILDSVSAVGASSVTDTAHDTPGPSASATMSISTAFNDHVHPGPYRPDVELLSADGVLFAVSSSMLVNSSSNGFAHVLSTPHTRQTIREGAEVLNLILHAAYGMSPAAYKPTVQLCLDAIRQLPTYGMDPHTYVKPGAPLYEALRPFIPLAPLRVYAVAGSCDLYELAQTASAHLLSFPIHTISDADADEMTAVYLKRLFLLQHSRVLRLRDLLGQPPEFHPETSTCAFKAQKALAQAWGRCVALMIAEARPDTSNATLRERLSTLKDDVTCDHCKNMLEARIWKAVVDWTMSPMTI